MNSLVFALIAVLCNVLAQLAMKFASQQGFRLNDVASYFRWPIFLSAVLYGLSFLLTIRVLSNTELSVASPLMAGLTFVFVVLSSRVILGEVLDAQKLVGLFLILVGVMILAVRK